MHLSAWFRNRNLASLMTGKARLRAHCADPFHRPVVDVCSARARGLVLRETPGIAQGLPQEEFHLRIQAAQVVVSPTLHGRQHLGVDPQGKGLPGIVHQDDR